MSISSPSLHLTGEIETWKMARPFTIARGSRTQAEVLIATLSDERGILRGRGEAVPCGRYGETLDSSRHEITLAAQALSQGRSLSEVLEAMRPGAARNALDCAVWDWRCKCEGRSITDLLGRPALKAVTTAYTLSIDSLEVMETRARAEAARPILKIKTGADRVLESVAAVRRGAPQSVLLVDANEAWPEADLSRLLAGMAELGVALVEQPLPAGRDQALAAIAHPVPIYADEAFHTADRIGECLGKYDGVNIKLDKTGGLSEALRAVASARSAGMGVMVGCMVGTSLGMAPALVVAQEADYVDLDGPLLLGQDREDAILYQGSRMEPFQSRLWG